MQITPPPPIIVFAGVWMAYRPSPIIFSDRHADPGNQRRPDQGQLRYRQVKNYLAATSVKNFPLESPNKIICKQVCRLDSFTFGRFVVKCFVLMVSCIVHVLTIVQIFVVGARFSRGL